MNKDVFYVTRYKLEQWGIWSRQDGTAKMAMRCGSGFMPVISDNEALWIDRIIASMKNRFPKEYQLIHEHYRKTKPLIDIAESFNCSRKTIEASHKLALATIDAYLNPIKIENN